MSRMTDDAYDGAPPRGHADPEGYVPPALTRLGELAELTQSKTVGGADGSTFLGLDIGSI